MNKKFEVVYAEFIEAEDFFDAVKVCSVLRSKEK